MISAERTLTLGGESSLFSGRAATRSPKRLCECLESHEIFKEEKAMRNERDGADWGEKRVVHSGANGGKKE